MRAFNILLQTFCLFSVRVNNERAWLMMVLFFLRFRDRDDMSVCQSFLLIRYLPRGNKIHRSFLRLFFFWVETSFERVEWIGCSLLTNKKKFFYLIYFERNAITLRNPYYFNPKIVQIKPLTSDTQMIHVSQPIELIY